jgi:hypothetical protein
MLLSLSMLLLVTVWGIRSVTGVLIAGVGFYLIPHLFNDNDSWLYLLTGLGAIGISRQPEGVVGDLIARFGRTGTGAGGLSTLRTGRTAATGPMKAAVLDADG